jgi:hypothetical protein
MNARLRFTTLILAALTLASASVGSAVIPAFATGAVATPNTAASGDTPPPITATATPRPAGTLIKYSGELLDDRAGFAFFTTGDAFRLDSTVKIDDAATGGPTKLVPQTRTFARATFDSATGTIVELSLSRHKLPDEATFDAIRKFVVALSTPFANPDLASHGEGNDGRNVLVTFVVEVPPKTAFDDPVYIATDKSGWSATALRMDRVDALHYNLTMPIASGTVLLYRYTRGSWSSAERGQNGLEVPPRKLVVTNGDVRTKNDTVYGWGDSNEFSPNLGGGVPTPFNPIPFNVPPRR